MHANIYLPHTTYLDEYKLDDTFNLNLNSYYELPNNSTDFMSHCCAISVVSYEYVKYKSKGLQYK